MPASLCLLAVQFRQAGSEVEKHRAFHQGAQGVRYFHSFGIIHRDLKLSNILVAQLNPLRVVVTDFGHATTATNSQDHMKGTVSYLPPEILELKERSKDPKVSSTNLTLYWSCKSEVYSYGLVGRELLRGYFKRPKTGVNKTLHDDLLKTLRESRTELGGIVENMLAWTPASRPKMQDVLLNPCWSEPETPFTSKKRLFPE